MDVICFAVCGTCLQLVCADHHEVLRLSVSLMHMRHIYYLNILIDHEV